MDNIFLPLFFAILGMTRILDVVSIFRDPRRTPALRVLDGCAAILLGLFLVGAGLWMYAPSQEFLSKAVPWASSFVVYMVPASGWLILKAIAWVIRRRQQPETLAEAVDRVTYTNVTRDPSALAQANRPEPMVRALEGLGFRSVCLVKTSMPPDEPNAISEINELFTSPDSRAFAEPETFFARDAIALRTMLSNGAIVDTTLLVDHALGTSFVQRRLARFNWPRCNRPGAGYYFQCLEDTSLDALWARHTQRLERIATQRGTHIPSQNSFESYVKLSQRGLKTSAGGRLTDLLVLALAVPTFIMLPLLLMALLRLRGVSGALFYLVTAPLVIPLIWAVVRLGRRLPLPVLDKMSEFAGGLNAFFR